MGSIPCPIISHFSSNRHHSSVDTGPSLNFNAIGNTQNLHLKNSTSIEVALVICNMIGLSVVGEFEVMLNPPSVAWTAISISVKLDRAGRGKGASKVRLEWMMEHGE